MKKNFRKRRKEEIYVIFENVKEKNFWGKTNKNSREQQDEQSGCQPAWQPCVSKPHK